MATKEDGQEVTPESLTHYGVIKSRLGAKADPDLRDVAAEQVAVLYQAWRMLQAIHPDLQNAFLKPGSGKELRRGKEGVGGHFQAKAWKAGERVYAEVMISGAVLARGALAVFNVLLHEGGHGIAWKRREDARAAGAEPKDIKKLEETSDRGRYHNGLFRSIMDELGADCYQVGRFGWWGTEVREDAKAVYAEILTFLEANLDVGLVVEEEKEKEGGKKREPRGGEGDKEDDDDEDATRDANLPNCGCPCGFSGRISMKQLTTRFPLCGLCGERIVPKDADLLAEYEPALAVFLGGRGGVVLTVLGSTDAGEAAAETVGARKRRRGRGAPTSTST